MRLGWPESNRKHIDYKHTICIPKSRKSKRMVGRFRRSGVHRIRSVRKGWPHPLRVPRAKTYFVSEGFWMCGAKSCGGRDLYASRCGVWPRSPPWPRSRHVRHVRHVRCGSMSIGRVLIFSGSHGTPSPVAPWPDSVDLQLGGCWWRPTRRSRLG